jgi:8-oxo-dGTP pyrophosphatase MutT (NUDIX family)
MGLNRKFTSTCGGTFQVTMRGSHEGAIKRHAAAAVVVRENKLLTVLLEDPTTKVTRHFLPGGKIEGLETPVDTAIRETLEETGYRVRVDLDSLRVHTGLFEWDGKLYNRENKIYRAHLLNETSQAVSDASYHRGVEWMELSRVPEAFAHIPKLAELIEEMLNDPEA